MAPWPYIVMPRSVSGCARPDVVAGVVRRLPGCAAPRRRSRWRRPPRAAWYGAINSYGHINSYGPIIVMALNTCGPVSLWSYILWPCILMPYILMAL